MEAKCRTDDPGYHDPGGYTDAEEARIDAAKNEEIQFRVNDVFISPYKYKEILVDILNSLQSEKRAQALNEWRNLDARYFGELPNTTKKELADHDRAMTVLAALMNGSMAVLKYNMRHVAVERITAEVEMEFENDPEKYLHG